VKSIPRGISKIIGQAVPLRFLANNSAPVFLPFYHVVSNKKIPYILNYPYRDESEFERELDFFLKYFIPVSLEYFTGNKTKIEPVMHLSFDDGLRECAEIVAPVLLKKGIPATFFVNTGFVDNKQLFHRYKASFILSEFEKLPKEQAGKFNQKFSGFKNRLLQISHSGRNLVEEMALDLEINWEKDVLDKFKPYMSLEQLKNLQNQGFTIGGHSHEHNEFYRISAEKQIQEIKKSMDWLKEKLNVAIKAFSFPYTDSGVSMNVFNQIRNENLCDLTFGTAGIKNDEVAFHIQRYPAEQPGNFVANLKSEYVYFFLRKLVGKETVKH